MKTLTCLLLLLLLHLASADATVTTRHPDCINSALLQNSNALTQVVKSVKIKYLLSLISTGAWSQFPDMAVIIDLPLAQEVMIKYSIQLSSGSSCYLMTRLIIDGMENDDFRVISGHAVDQSNSAVDWMWLPKGPHEIKVEYKTNNGRDQQMADWDFLMALFKIKYYEP